MFVELGGKIINTDMIQMVEHRKAFGEDYTRLTLIDTTTEVHTPYSEVKQVLFTQNWKRSNER